MQANESGDVERAGQLAAEMTRVAPESFEAWFEAGLHAKARRDWPRCAKWNERAMELFGQHQVDEYGGVNPAAWNLGIAATAIGDWALARRAWTTFGVTGMAAESNSPIDMDLGQVPIRLNPDRPSLTLQSVPEYGETEVVWCWRRSPAHAVIASVPLPESGHRFRDVVLHDGEPKGTRRNGESEVPVFDQLERLEESGLPTWQLQVEGATDEDLASLADLAGPRGLGLDDWSGIKVMCSTCSHGSADPDHVHPPAKPGSRTLGLAGDEPALAQVLDQWVQASPSRPRLLEFDLIW
ncbi:tetratricopeptide repeat protein [Nocardioides antri]|uniref:Tetratricopeptide repeat protein n=1 Tax=Nocardioides antri TaxID=2607659 RepID=A0A5B1M217_9ACTN|nr:tetratricopeptide repeat protein [Nocardioides antri]KAA1426972.1 tetratricopeptide repeat protein [Nocardioides antri]